MSVGAVQLEITINSKSFTIKKDHAVSLKMDRVIGDSANKFTLEAFDETAWQLENALMKGQMAPITVKYSSAEDLSKSYTFSGTCYDYQLTFVGRATMLSITGVLSSTLETTSGFWFGSQAIEWCGSDIDRREDGTIYVDGKSQAEFNNYKDNKDVCAIVKKDSYGVEQVYFNPSRIFERIIHVYNGDKLGSYNTGETTTYNSTNTVNLSKTKSTDVAWSFFRGKGFSEAAASGIMGNIEQEHSTWGTEETSGGIGIFQWTGGRAKNLKNWASKNNKNYRDLTTQLEFALKEMPDAFNSFTGFTKRYLAKTSSERAYYGWPKKMTLNDFKNQTDPSTCAEIFSRVFERPRKPRLENRKKYARSYYKAYTGKIIRVTTTVSEVTNQEYKQVKGWGTGGNNGFYIGKVDESRWVANLDTRQSASENTAEYINRVLCKNAVTQKYADYSNETAGFSYYMKNGKHYFKALDYAEGSKTKDAIKIVYGQKSSNVISFSIAQIGSIAMAGLTKDNQERYNANASTLSYLASDNITSGGEYIYGVDAKSRTNQNNKKELNWYLDSKSIKPVKVVSSTSQSNLDATVSGYFNNLKNLTISAELTLWADYSKTYYPGGYINITVIGAGNIVHYSSGIYYITQVTDSVSSEGYTQTLKLLKYQKDTDLSKARPYNGDEYYSEAGQDDNNVGITSYTRPEWMTDEAIKQLEEDSKPSVKKPDKNTNWRTPTPNTSKGITEIVGNSKNPALKDLYKNATGTPNIYGPTLPK